MKENSKRIVYENPSSLSRCSGTHGLHKLVRYINEHKLYPANDKGTRVRESLLHELCIANTTRYCWYILLANPVLLQNFRIWKLSEMVDPLLNF